MHANASRGLRYFGSIFMTSWSSVMRARVVYERLGCVAAAHWHLRCVALPATKLCKNQAVTSAVGSLLNLPLAGQLVSTTFASNEQHKDF